MADLSDADWKALLGNDYKTRLAERDAAAGITDATRAAKKKAEMLSNVMLTALGFAIVAGLIFSTNFYSVSGPYNATLAMGSAIVAIASLAVSAFAWRASAA